MHHKLMLPVFVAFVVAVAVVSVVNAQKSEDCPKVDDKGANATHLPNPYDCTTYYKCSQGVPILMPCGRRERFNRVLNTCDHWWRTPCIELPLPEQPSSEAPKVTKPVATEPVVTEPVATEKIVVTKTVKETYKPVD
ncbi:uncharacterized protein LOC142582027 [Dermacentor variabilis]|uniref:uncharacterized protein LOC142582027 n=1 Tax=Dermacentor variabilis TaxID=34621 RepID=UPI003F5CB171